MGVGEDRKAEEIGKRLLEGGRGRMDTAEFKSGSGITGGWGFRARGKGTRIVSILAYNMKTTRIGLVR